MYIKEECKTVHWLKVRPCFKGLLQVLNLPLRNTLPRFSIPTEKNISIWYTSFTYKLISTFPSWPNAGRSYHSIPNAYRPL